MKWWKIKQPTKSRKKQLKQEFLIRKSIIDSMLSHYREVCKK